jgi:hypothetical protein
MSCKVSPSSVPEAILKEVFKNNPDPWHCDWKRDPIGALKCLFYEQRRLLEYPSNDSAESAIGMGSNSVAPRNLHAVFGETLRTSVGDWIFETAIASAGADAASFLKFDLEHARIPGRVPRRKL